ncbi:MAG: aspartyl aminopeptidase [Myxococcota bacterium]|jgi:aspartyl aminopeptidase
MPIADVTQGLVDYINASPTPYHCVQETARQLDVAGFTALDEDARWSLDASTNYYVHREGTILAFRTGTEVPSEAGFRIIGAHTDSPNLRIKPRADIARNGYQQLGVETYGGVLAYTWLDRDLGLAGRVMVRDDASPTKVSARYIDIRKPVLRIPSLAIHLNRTIRTDGFKLNAQKHLVPVLGMASLSGDEGPEGTLARLLGEHLDVASDAVLTWDLMLADTLPATVGGWDDSFVFAPRLDNQGSCHAALAALLASIDIQADVAATRMICLYDHEECGSKSAVGAEGPMVEWTLRRIARMDASDSNADEAFARSMARSLQISADMAHAIHPNYADKHEPQHQPVLNAGPVIKLNTNQRYATTGEGAAIFESLCQDAGVPCQSFVTRSDLACGTTLGPISSARLGIRTIDVGNPMWSMHSIREQAGSHDHPHMVAAMAGFFGLAS